MGQAGSRSRRRRSHAHRTEHRSEEHTSELQSQSNLVCRLLLEKKKKQRKNSTDLMRVNFARRIKSIAVQSHHDCADRFSPLQVSTAKHKQALVIRTYCV